MALLSNAGRDFGSYFRHGTLGDLFEKVFVSGELGTIKPSRRDLRARDARTRRRRRSRRSSSTTKRSTCAGRRRSASPGTSSRLPQDLRAYLGGARGLDDWYAFAFRSPDPARRHGPQPHLDLADVPVLGAGRVGRARSWHLVHLGSFATGGSGLVFSEATAVSPEGRIAPRDTGIWTDEQRRRVEADRRVHRAAGRGPGIQLAHAGPQGVDLAGLGLRGRKPAASRRPRAAGAPSRLGDRVRAATTCPRHWRRRASTKVVDDFRAAARRSRRGGLPRPRDPRGARLSAAPVPVPDLEPAHRRVRRLAREPRAPAAARRRGRARGGGRRLPLFVRFSASDWAEGGWDEDQTATVAGWAEAAGADFFDISSGGIQAGIRIPVEPGYQVPFAAARAQRVRSGCERGRAHHDAGAGGRDRPRAAARTR